MPNVCLFPDRDTTISAFEPDTNYGGNPGLYLGVTYSGGGKTNRFRILMHFTIPPEVNTAEVYKGILNLGYGDSINLGVGVDIDRIAIAGGANWTEAGATWNKYDGVNAWANPGGDFTLPVVYSTTPLTNLYYWWNIDITNLVTDAIANRGRSLDIIIFLSNESPGISTEVTAMSKEYTTIPAYRPFLNIVRPPFGMPKGV